MIKERQGFSLIELSIVLVILGLLTGGILAGQSLIHASAVRATIAQMTDLDTAINTFHDKYLGLPGDMKNATEFWPTATNGNGNGMIEASAACVPGHTIYEPDCPFFDGERSQFFVQLGLAGLTTGYDGTPTLNRGYPSIKLHPNQGMFVAGPWINTGGSNMKIELYATDSIYLYMGVCNAALFSTSNDGFNDCAIFLPEEVWNIDTKLDDGLPLSGKVLGESYNTACVTGTPAAPNNAYNLSNTSVACNMLYSLH